MSTVLTPCRAAGEDQRRHETREVHGRIDGRIQREARVDAVEIIVPDEDRQERKDEEHRLPDGVYLKALGYLDYRSRHRREGKAEEEHDGQEARINAGVAPGFAEDEGKRSRAEGGYQAEGRQAEQKERKGRA